jgi:Leucine-rich repeat (LRR) protein
MQKFDLMKKFFFILFLFTLSSTKASVSSMEREALVTLYNATDGANWDFNDNWLVGDPCENNWYGIGCNEFRNSGNDIVTSLYLQSNNLSGSIPSQLTNLTNLDFIYLSSNTLTGIIPSELSGLKNLEEIDLSFNQLTGNIPHSIGNLTHLTGLYLNSNNLSGQIPEELGELTNLTTLNLSRNKLNGELPQEIRNLINLEQLELMSNKLTGIFPVNQILNLINLKSLDLSNNYFSARSLPIELAVLNNLETLSLSGNNLTGTLLGISAFNHLDTLNLCGNQFTGQIPIEIGNLTNLTTLELCFNKLSGTIPDEIGNLTNLRSLFLHQNNLTGTIPDEMGNMVNISALILQGNQLSGEIPLTFINLINLNIIFSINWNNLYTNNAELALFINSIGNSEYWKFTQSLAPENVQIIASSSTSISLNWDTSNSLIEGGYQMYMATNIAGPFSLIHETHSKSVTAHTQAGLLTGQDYYFKIKTFTHPHRLNKNRVISKESNTVLGTTDTTIGTVDLFTGIFTNNIDTLNNKTPIGNEDKSKLGNDFTYSILAGNTGVDQAINADFRHIIPLGLENSTWTCATNSGMATCPNAFGTGNIDEILDLPINSILEYQVTVFRDQTHKGSIYLSTTVTPPDNMNDSDFTDNSQVANIIENVFTNEFE